VGGGWGSAALLQRIGDSAVRPRLVAEMEKNLDRRGGPESLLMTAAPDKEFIGKTLARIAQERGTSSIEAALTIIQK